MLDIRLCLQSGRRPTAIESMEFCRIELFPLSDGRILVSLTATLVDDQEPQLLDQEIVSECVTTIDDVLALIRAHVAIATRTTMKEH